MGKTGKCQSRLRQLPLGRTQCRGQMLADQYLLRLAQRFEAGGHQSGNQHQTDHRQGPAKKGRHKRPADQEQAGQPGWNQAAPQVVKELPL